MNAYIRIDEHDFEDLNDVYAFFNARAKQSARLLCLEGHQAQLR